ncbi:MAG: hypothetical protein M1816_007581 [Peltula sp. TS41687]|nr:MAG: hypothetical protein M1816_007581 [Peltula sp. TS41687]
MQLHLICLASTLLGLVTAMPAAPKDPRAWQTYSLRRPPHPPFPPPDIGSVQLGPEYFRDYPDLTENQKQYIRLKSQRLHEKHQKDMMKRWYQFGEQPTGEMVTRRAQEIEEELRRTCIGLQAKTTGSPIPPEVPIGKMKKKIQAQIKKLELAKAEEREANNAVVQAKKDAGKALTRISDHNQETAKIEAEIRTLRNQQSTFQEGTPEYEQVAEQINQRRSRLVELKSLQRDAETALGSARKRRRSSSTKIKILNRTIGETEAKIRELTDELEALRGRTEADTENQTEDRNNLFINTVENAVEQKNTLPNAVKQWTQGVSSSLKRMIHKVSTPVQQAGDITRSRPFGGILPNVGPMGSLVGVP